jgi:CBS domain-containing protein
MGRTKQQLGPLLMSVLFVVLGLLVLWAARYWINDPNTAMGDAVFVSLLVLPILIYAIISGSITELRGPGGVGATFNALATNSVEQSETVGRDLVSVEEGSVISKGGVNELKKKQRDLDENSPILMIITFGGGHYDLEALKKYVHALSNSRNFRFIVFLDQDKRFLGYIPSLAFANILDTPDVGEGLVKAINEGNLPTLLSYPGMVQTNITTSTTNAEALRQMVNKNLGAVVVTDTNNRLVGVAEREQVLTKLMLALIK